MHLVLAVCLLATLLGGASACKVFSEGPWAKEHTPNWEATSMAPWCKADIDSYPYLFQQRTFKGYFVTVPSGAGQNYQDNLDAIIMFKWHCLKTCVDDYGTQVVEPIDIGQGDAFADSPDPEIVTLKCTCAPGMTTPSINMLQLDTKWMAECHYQATTTVVTTTSTTTTTTTQIPTVFNKTIEIGCFQHTLAQPRIAEMPEFISTDGHMVIAPLSADTCGFRCHSVDPLYVFGGVTQSNQCWCGKQSASSMLLWWSALNIPNACSTWIDNYVVNSAVPCADTTGAPAFANYPTDMSPRAGWEWCGGNGIMKAFAIKTTPSSFPQPPTL